MRLNCFSESAFISIKYVSLGEAFVKVSSFVKSSPLPNIRIFDSVLESLKVAKLDSYIGKTYLPEFNFIFLTAASTPKDIKVELSELSNGLSIRLNQYRSGYSIVPAVVNLPISLS